MPDSALDRLLESAVPFALPLRRRFRGLSVREGVLILGPRGWGEFAPFDDYSDAAAARWLGSAIEAAYGDWPTPVRDSVEVNAIVPAVPADDAIVLARDAVLGHGCRTVKVKVSGTDLAADEARVAGVRDVLDTVLGRGVGALRIDANGAWDLPGAVSALRRLAAYRLEYVEQPCRTADELAELRQRVDVPIAADESIRTAADPTAVDVREFADIAICKPAPLGGVAATVEAARAAGVPVVVSGSLDSGVGLSVALAAAGALVDLRFACGLGTGALLAEDLLAEPLVPVDGRLRVERVHPDLDRLVTASARVGAERARFWRARIAAAFAAGAMSRWRALLGEPHARVGG